MATAGRPVVGVIGTGNMGSALVRGWGRAAEVVSSIAVYDRDERRAADLAAEAPELVTFFPTVRQVTEASRRVVVALKPQDMDAGLAELAAFLNPNHVVISTAAGVNLDRLRRLIGSGPSLCRIMPNLAVGVGEGYVALAPEQGMAEEMVRELLELFGGLGLARVLPEDLFNGVTALTGSGPGLMALLFEALEDGAVRVGIPRETAREAVQQMTLGAVRLLQEELIPPGRLKEKVSSAGGTTIAGLAVLEDRGVRGALIRAVEAAAERGRQL